MIRKLFTRIVKEIWEMRECLYWSLLGFLSAFWAVKIHGPAILTWGYVIALTIITPCYYFLLDFIIFKVADIFKIDYRSKTKES